MKSPSNATLRASYGDRDRLTNPEVSEMRGLLERFFDGVDEEQFARDLEEKSHVLRVWKGDDLVGFSTLLAYRTVIEEKPCNILYSGDTIMSPACWNSPVLARGWIAMVKGVQASLPAGRCLWLLLSAGFRTYRILPVFWLDFWPRFDEEMPDDLRALRHAIAGERFGECYDPVAGVVRFTRPNRLSGAMAEVPDGRCDDPHVAYFLQQNPGWREGDELVCLTEITDTNLTPAGRRIARDTG